MYTITNPPAYIQSSPTRKRQHLSVSTRQASNKHQLEITERVDNRGVCNLFHVDQVGNTMQCQKQRKVGEFIEKSCIFLEIV